MRFIMTACPGEYGPNVVICLRWCEQLAQARVELLCCLPRDRVVAANGALLFGYLLRRVEPYDAGKTRACEPVPRRRDLLFEHGCGWFFGALAFRRFWFGQCFWIHAWAHVYDPQFFYR